MSSYPVALVNLDRARCVVVGGGRIAARKVSALREGGSHPVVISPVLCESLRRQAADGEIQVIEREYRAGDLEGASLVIAATDDPAVNEAVWREAALVGSLVNVVDDPEHCNFYLPAMVRRGDLTISISTSGNSPSLARRIREALEVQFDDAYGPYLALLGELRPLVKERIPEPARRQALWIAVLDSEILELLRDDRDQTALQRALDIVDAFS